jgi:Tfp pilus assembly protein PilE
MMIAVTVILIVASIGTPIYMTCAVRAREALLRDHLLEAASSQPSVSASMLRANG